MIPPCAIANWLYGLHGEAFEEAGFLVFNFLLLSQITALSTVDCFFQVGHRGEQN